MATPIPQKVISLTSSECSIHGFLLGPPSEGNPVSRLTTSSPTCHTNTFPSRPWLISAQPLATRTLSVLHFPIREYSTHRHHVPSRRPSAVLKPCPIQQAILLRP